MMRLPRRSTLFPYTTLFRSNTEEVSIRQLADRICVLTGSSSPIKLVPYDEAYESRSEEHTSELQSQSNLVCRLLLEKKNIPPLRNLLLGCSRVFCDAVRLNL